MKALQKVFNTACAVAALTSIMAMQPARAADIANGKALADAHNCSACHGPGLAKPVSGDYPKLAGQHADYLYWALRQYQMGNGNPNFGRSNAIMSAQVQSLSESDLRDISAYIESLPGDLVLKK
jgi:cytochrome c553